MSRFRTLGASLFALVAGTGIAAAADIPAYEPPPAAVYSPAPAFSWTGPYVGLQGGYGWGGSTVTHNGWIGGAYAGYNFQTATNFVVGLEGDFTFTGKTGTLGTTTVSNPWNGTVRGRVGYAYDKFLFYGTAGVAVGGVNVNDTVGPTTNSATRVGWVAGVGVEAALTENVTGRVEFRHTNLGTTTFGTGPNVNVTSNDLLVGIGFKF